MTVSQGSLLHVGCGGEPLPVWAQGHFSEVRLDIDARHNPDITASMVDMGDIGPFNAVLSAHSLEHLYPHEVQKALGEFRRVLADGGYAVIFVPDLEDVRATDDMLYESAAGPVTGLDMIYGMRSLLQEYPHMAHHTGFTAGTLKAELTAAGFSSVTVERRPNYELLAIAVK